MSDTSTGEPGGQGGAGGHGSPGVDGVGGEGGTGGSGGVGGTGVRGLRGYPGMGVPRWFLVSVPVSILLLSVAFGSLFYRFQSDAYDECVARNVNAERLNTLAHRFIVIEQENPYRTVSPETINDRIEAYEDSILTIPDCDQLGP